MENIEEVLDWTENLILKKTGESLKPIEVAILKGVWSGKKYSQIAKKYNDCSESLVKKEASKLWEKLREELEEDLKKKNFRSKVEKRHRISDISQCSNCVLQEIDINIVSQFVQSGELAGQHLTKYKDYATIFQQIAKTAHQSCVIFLSWEKPIKITTLKAEKSSSQALYLKGLESGAKEILQEHGLTDSEKWSDLINLYQGHQTWLNIIASNIIELFDSSVALFLANQEQIFIGDLKPILASHLERLSQEEKQVISWFSKHQAVDIF